MMNTTPGLSQTLSIQLRIKGGQAEIPLHQWACVRFLGEDEVIDLLRDRMGKSEADVRDVLASYHRDAAAA